MTAQQAKIERAKTEQPITAPGIGKRSSGRKHIDAEPGGGARPMIDLSIGRGGSIVLVLLVAVLLVGAATAIVLIGGNNADPYILGFLAVLATVGVFSLFAFACGILRPSAAPTDRPLIKALVDGATDAIVVTDGDGRVVYVNAAYLDLIGATGLHDMRPVERAFIGDADASEAIYRLLKAAREGRRPRKKCASPASKAGRRAGCALKSARSERAAATRSSRCGRSPT